jgi:hypothetical protein
VFRRKHAILFELMKDIDALISIDSNQYLGASLTEQQGRVQQLTAKPKLFISSKLTDLDEEGNPVNFLVKEIENLRWEEAKTELGIEQKGDVGQTT